MTALRFIIYFAISIFIFVSNSFGQQFLAVETTDSTIYYHISDLYIDFENITENDKLILTTTSGTEILNLSNINEITFEQITSIDDELAGRVELPQRFELLPPYPNPFNPETNISLIVYEETDICATVYNSLGQEVQRIVNGTQMPGYHIFSFNGDDYGAGIYFVSVRGENSKTSTQKIVLLK